MGYSKETIIHGIPTTVNYDDSDREVSQSRETLVHGIPTTVTTDNSGSAISESRETLIHGIPSTVTTGGSGESLGQSRETISHGNHVTAHTGSGGESLGESRRTMNHGSRVIVHTGSFPGVPRSVSSTPSSSAAKSSGTSGGWWEYDSSPSSNPKRDAGKSSGNPSARRPMNGPRTTTPQTNRTSLAPPMSAVTPAVTGTRDDRRFLGTGTLIGIGIFILLILGFAGSNEEKPPNAEEEKRKKILERLRKEEEERRAARPPLTSRPPSIAMRTDLKRFGITESAVIPALNEPRRPVPTAAKIEKNRAKLAAEPWRILLKSTSPSPRGAVRNETAQKHVSEHRPRQDDELIAYASAHCHEWNF
jgi:hypothetical protein